MKMGELEISVDQDEPLHLDSVSPYINVDETFMKFRRRRVKTKLMTREYILTKLYRIESPKIERKQCR